MQSDLRKLLGNTPRYKKVWSAGTKFTLGGSAGHALVMCLAAAPNKWIVNESQIWALEKDQKSRWDIRGVMERGVELGYFGSYARCLDIDDVIDCIVRRGPVVCYLPWYESFRTPALPSGLLEIDGVADTDNCVLANGYWPRHPDFGDVIVLTSTNPEWGINGRAYIQVGALLDIDFDAYVPLDVLPKSKAVVMDVTEDEQGNVIEFDTRKWWEKK